MTEANADDPAITGHLLSGVPAGRWGLPSELDCCPIFGFTGEYLYKWNFGYS